MASSPRVATASSTRSTTRRALCHAEVLDAVVDDREEVVITRAPHDPVAIVCLADFESLRETAYLMRSPANARRLLDAMQRLETNEGQVHDLANGVIARLTGRSVSAGERRALSPARPTE